MDSSSRSAKGESPHCFSILLCSQGNSDCRTCNRRRIRCDRTLPSCRKCFSKGLSCPGYKTPLKWVCGSASKGLNRRSFDDISFAALKASDATKKHLSGPNDVQLSTSYVACLSSPQWSMTALPPALQSASLRRLWYHFDRTVAPQLAWIENGKNPWRALIMPLALNSESLLHTVIAIAAGNVYARVQNNSANEPAHAKDLTGLRNKALSLLTRDIKALQDTGFRQHELTMSAILASIILWCHLEMHWPSSNAWQLHMRGAKALIEHSVSSETLPKAEDATQTFLLHEFHSVSTWPLLTDFRTTNDESWDFLPFPESSAFVEFIRILRHVTKVERCLHKGVYDAHIPSLEAEMQAIKAQLSHARESALELKRPVQPCDSQTQIDDFSHLVDAFFHACLIYSYHVLLSPPQVETFLSEARDELVRSLKAFRDPTAFAQDQAWPLFIAGTESRGDVANQCWIELRMKGVMRHSCALDRPKMMEFLKSFWLLQETTKDNWIDYGRKWTQHKPPFLIL